MIRRIIVAASMVLSTASLCGCIMLSGNPPLPAQTPTAPPTPAAETASKPVTKGVVGEKLSAGAWTVTIEEVNRTGKSIGGQKPASGEELLLVTAGFYNNGTDSLDVRPQDFQLVDSNGKPVVHAKISQAAYNANSMRPLMPRFGTSSIFVYRVPAGSKRFTFVFTPPELGTRLEWRVP